MNAKSTDVSKRAEQLLWKRDACWMTRDLWGKRRSMRRETVSNPGYYPCMHMVKKSLTACFVLCVLLPRPYLSCKKANAAFTSNYTQSQLCKSGLYSSTNHTAKWCLPSVALNTLFLIRHVCCLWKTNTNSSGHKTALCYQSQWPVMISTVKSLSQLHYAHITITVVHIPGIMCVEPVWL